MKDNISHKQKINKITKVQAEKYHGQDISTMDYEENGYLPYGYTLCMSCLEYAHTGPGLLCSRCKNKNKNKQENQMQDTFNTDKDLSSRLFTKLKSYPQIVREAVAVAKSEGFLDLELLNKLLLEIDSAVGITAYTLIQDFPSTLLKKPVLVTEKMDQNQIVINTNISKKLNETIIALYKELECPKYALVNQILLTGLAHVDDFVKNADKLKAEL